MAELTKRELQEQLATAVRNTGGKPMAQKKIDRTSGGLRDLLFDEIEELRSGNGDPRKALAVAGVARQIMNTVRVEMDFVRLSRLEDENIKNVPPKLGVLELGAVASAGKPVTDR